MNVHVIAIHNIVGRYRFLKCYRESHRCAAEIREYLCESTYTLNGKLYLHPTSTIHFYLLIGIIFPSMKAYVVQGEQQRLIQLCNYINEQHDQFYYNPLINTEQNVFSSIPWEFDFLSILDDHLTSITPYLSNEFLKILKSFSTRQETVHWKDLLDNIQYN
jgi:hypothetical protein